MALIKKVFYSIKDNMVQIIDIVILAIAVFAPKIFNVHVLFEQYVNNNIMTPDNMFFYWVIQKSNLIIGIVLCMVALWRVRKYNKDHGAVMNRDNNIYHDYPYVWYWFSAKILDITKCNLINVPIYMQVKLVIHSIFDEYPFDENIFPEVESELIREENKNFRHGQKCEEVNLIIEDTYPIEFAQITHSKRMLPTIIVSRNNGKSFDRHYNQEFVSKVNSIVRALGENITVNVFATVNPQNCFYISKGTFAMSDRGNVKHLYVYQQKNTNGRHFWEKGKKVY